MKRLKQKGFFVLLLTALVFSLFFSASTMAATVFYADSGVYDLVGESTNDHTDAFYLWEHQDKIYVAISTSLKQHQLWGLTINGEEVDTSDWLLDGSNLTVKDSASPQTTIIDNEPATGKAAVDYFWLIGKVDIDISEEIVINLSSPGGFALVNVVYTVQGALNVFHEYPPDDPFQDFDQSEASNTIGGLDVGVYVVFPEVPPTKTGYEYSSVTITVDGELLLTVDSGETDNVAIAEGNIGVAGDGKVTANLTEVCAKIINVNYIYSLIDYTVSYDANTGTGTLIDPDSPYNYEDTVTVLDPEVVGNIAKVGHDFVEWNTKADGSGTAYNPGATFSMPAEDVVLYAQWEAIDYTVTYDANTGTDAPVDSDSPYNYDDEVTVLGPEAMTKTGYTFVEWNTQADGNGTAYGPGDTFNMPANDVILYAQWEAIPDECDCEWVEETAWAGGPRYTPRGNWATYTPYVADSTVTLYAGQHMEAGTVHFSAAVDGFVTITINLNNDWRFAAVSENVKIQDYANAPRGNPAPGRFAYKGNVDTAEASFSMVVPANDFYGVHVNVEWFNCVCE